MAEFGGGLEQKHPNLNLSPEEQRLFTQVFSAADSDSLGVVTGDVALRFFPERTKLPSEILGEIWQIADTEDKGFLTPAGFYIILRLIGYAQAGRPVSAELALKPGGPLPKFDGINSASSTPAPLQAQGSGGPIRVPPLAPDKASQYAALFSQSGAVDGFLPGNIAKQIFDRAQLPNDILVKIWNLADTEHRGMLSTTEFIIAMHLLASYRIGALRALPQNLPAGLYEAAARRGASSRPVSTTSTGPNIPPASALPRQFSGAATQRTSSPLARQAYKAPPGTSHFTGANSDWAISAPEKTQYDNQFAKLDAGGQGFVSGEQAVGFFSNSRLPEDDLAQIWDLSDINSEGQLNRDEFAVAMHLIRQQLAKKGPIPTTLPANLIPPSMRPMPQSPTGAFAPPSPTPKAKSAAEDLFGLDAFSTPGAPAAQAPQSTGGSSAVPAAPPAASPAPISQPSQSTLFKPFVPSSSFGQGIVSPQPTGASPSKQTGSLQASDDLLGDNDPEISKKLTQETTELANLSNQVSTLTNQMQDVKSKRAASEQNMSQVNAQKRDFEFRLSQLRAAYEKEARDLKELEDRFAVSKNDTKKTQADLAMVQHTYANLQEQKQQVMAALEADQAENANLKERIRSIDIEIRQFKPQLEKMRSDARQQKGLVAINRKQLCTNEAERDRVKADLEGTTNEHQEATRELETTNQALERQKSVSPAPAALPTVTPTAAFGEEVAASPAPSTTSQSTNPFFRRTTTGSSDRNTTRSPFTPEAATPPNHTAFDSFFGSSFPAPGGAFVPPTEAPPTSFGTMPVPQAANAAPPSEEAINSENREVDAEPITPTQHTLPGPSQLPPPPPQSRQISSSALPLQNNLLKPESPTSSVGVAAPASRFGGSSRNTTPTRDTQSAISDLSHGISAPSTSSGFVTPQEAASESLRGIPGSFPGDLFPTATPVPDSSQEDPLADPFVMSQPGFRTPLSAKDDFDSAFAGFGDKEKARDSAGTFSAPKPSHREEFPPIREFGGDDSDSESEKGFDDNFSPAVVSQPASHEPGQGVPKSETLEPFAAASESRPDFSREASNLSQLPTPGAMGSPPTYDQAVPPAEEGAHRDSNLFPAEFSGLLPAREDPTSHPNLNPEHDVVVHSPSPVSAVRSISDGEPSIAASTSAPSHFKPVTNKPTHSGQPPIPPKDAFDDFDNQFGDLSEAKPADEKGDEEFTTHQDPNSFDEFNPTFDSPTESKTTTLNSAFQGSAFDDFESSISGPGTSAATGNAAPAPLNHDWDSLFAGVGAEESVHTNGNGTTGHLAPTNGGFGDAADTSTKPPFSRAISTGTEHDDPILKRLTAMGYARNDSLAALEKFDYNLDKAADYLTSKG